MPFYLSTIQSFCAAHRLHNPELSDEENKKQFGRCNHISSHGHNYKVEATVVGEINPTYGYVLNLRILKELLFNVVDPLDHKRLDTDIEFFKKKGVIATTENIGYYIWHEMEDKLPSNAKLYNIRVFETEKCFIDYKA